MPTFGIGILRTIVRLGVISLAFSLVFPPNPAESGDKNDELRRAAQTGSLEEVTGLLDEGTNVNGGTRRGTTALMMAAESGHVGVARILLARGADVNAKTRNGWTALMAASERAYPEVVRLLLDNGADVRARNNDGWAPMMLACQQHLRQRRIVPLQHGLQINADRVEVVRLLISKNADVNEKHAEGETALMWAVREGHVDLVKTLLEKGADVTAELSVYAAAPTTWRHTALGLAKVTGNKQIEALLRASGAKK